MTVNSDEEVLEATDVSVEFMRKVEILLILMSFILAMLHWLFATYRIRWA